MSELSLQGFLDECEREQLHRARAIQPYGALLGGMSGDPQIRFVSANLADWIGRTPESALGQPLSAILPGFPPRPAEDAPLQLAAGGALSTDALAWTQASTEKRLFRNLTSGPRGSLDGILSATPDNWLLELEAALPSDLGHEAYRPVPHQLYRMPYAEDEWAQQSQYLIDELRAVTGFERVMLYRFRDDECGEVIRESLAEGLAPYLGLRYPASDIPQIARTLYLTNRHRQIPDIAAPAVPLRIEPGVTPDLSLSDLRAVSPVHLEYLKNMEVTASLSFSLVLFGRLWGLIACHHSAPRSLPLPVRERCAEMAQVFTLAIAGYQNNRRLLDVSGSDRDLTRLIDAIHQAEALRRLSRSEQERQGRPGPILGRALLSLVNAEGAALIEGEEIIRFGITPDEDEIRAEAAWVMQQSGEPIFSTDNLPALFPPATAWADRASGLLMVRIQRFDERGGKIERVFLWWRPEQPRTVYWAGDPRKTAWDEQAQRLSPRSSFEQWSEITSGHSEPWTEADLLRARKFRSLVLRDINSGLLRR